MKVLMRLGYLLVGGMLSFAVIGEHAMRRLNAVRAAHIDGVFQSYVLGCVMGSETKDGSNAKCKKMALKHQAEIRKILSE